MSNPGALLKRAQALLKKADQLQSERDALPLWQQWGQAGALIHEGLMRKLALLSEDQELTPERIHMHCQQVDLELAQKRTPEEQTLLARYRRAFPCTGARERLMQRLERYQGSETA